MHSTRPSSIVNTKTPLSAACNQQVACPGALAGYLDILSNVSNSSHVESIDGECMENVEK
jgi:hypothetical protein